jgi:3-dehydroquinate dehydratase-1
MIKGKLCAAIVAKDSDSMLESAVQALEKGADLVEFRLDHLVRIDDTLTDRLKAFSDRCVVTIRKKSQGGAFTGPEEERLRWLKKFSSINPLYLDIELDAAKANPDVTRVLLKNCKNVIFSFHEFDSTPELETLAEKYKDATGLGGIAKIVTMAKSQQDNITSMLLYNGVGNKGTLIAFTMGELGVLTRLLCLYAGSPISYVSLGNNASAPGQVPLEIMKRLMNEYYVK